MSKNKQLIYIIIIFFIVWLVLVYGTKLFNQQIDKKITNYVYKQLSDLSHIASDQIKMQIDEQFYKLEALSSFISKQNNFQSDTVTQLLSDFAQYNNYLNVAVASPDGSFITHKRVTDGNVSDRDFFKLGMEGIKNVTGPFPAVVDPTISVVGVSTPITQNDEVVGVLTATYSTSSNNQIFSTSIFEGNGYILLVNSQGEIISNLTKEIPILEKNLLSILNKTNDNLNHNLKILENLKNGLSDVTYIEQYDGLVSYASYKPVGINDWYIFTIVPHEFLNKQLDSIKTDIFILGLVLGTAALILVVYIIFVQWKSHKELVAANLNLKKSDELYRIIIAQSESTIFEYDLKSKVYKCSEGYERMFKAFSNDPDDFILSEKYIHPDDLDDYGIVCYALTKAKPSATMEIRLKQSQNTYIWCKLSMTIIFEEDGTPSKLVGNIEDIHHAKLQTEILKQKASRDNLTGLYNKATTEMLINDILRESTSGKLNAMISADLDNFKAINDSFGHLFGDEVLKDMANLIKSTFRSDDVLGRFGGDEFIIFIRDLSSVDSIKDKAQELLSRFDGEYVVDGKKYSVSISIGISVSPYDGDCYYELYKKADEALINAKKAGKQCFKFYSENIV